ncbi:MAG: hypothetical protein LRY27_00740 [Chitinophagales bacterium]|nr:hypothetical protein [Chitinophagales bacterium]
MAFNIGLLLYYLVFEGAAFKKPLVLLSAAGALIAAFFTFYWGTPLPFIANIISVSVLNALVYAPQLSFLSGLLQGACKPFLGVPYILFHLFNRKSSTTNHSDMFKKILLTALALIIVAIFFVLYQNANPEFFALTQKSILIG